MMWRLDRPLAVLVRTQSSILTPLEVTTQPTTAIKGGVEKDNVFVRKGGDEY